MMDDDVFEALAHSQRRRLLADLLDQDPQHIPTLSGDSREIVGAHETLLDVYLSGSLEVAGADKALVRLHYVHLPRLAESDFVEWDPEALVVSKGPRFEDLRPLLELLAHHEEHPVAEAAVVRR